MGVSMRATTNEKKTEMAAVQPNSTKNLPTIPVIKAVGKKTAIRVNVVAMTASPISSAASQARYAKSALNAQYKTLRATLSNGTGQVTMRWSAGDSGYYLIRVTGARQAHSATCVVCVSSSDHRGGISSVTDAAARLAIAPDKDKYVPGGKAKITIGEMPSCAFFSWNDIPM